MDSFRIAVIDDSPVCTKSVELCAKKYSPGIEIVGSFNDPVIALSKLPELKPDLILLDIEMPNMTGFELLEKLRDFNGGVIFITSHTKYAIKAFKFSAVDYLLKPVQQDDFDIAIDKFRTVTYPKPNSDSVKELVGNLNFSAQPQLQRIAVSSFDGIEIVNIAEIIYFKAENSYTRIKWQGKKDLLVPKTLKNFEKMLANSQFIRVHNTYLINFDKVVRIIRAEGGRVVMEDGTEIGISRSYKEKFHSYLKNTIRIQGKD